MSNFCQMLLHSLFFDYMHYSSAIFHLQCLFRTPLNNYDAVVLLHRDRLPYPRRLLFPSEVNRGISWTPSEGFLKPFNFCIFPKWTALLALHRIMFCLFNNIEKIEKKNDLQWLFLRYYPFPIPMSSLFKYSYFD